MPPRLSQRHGKAKKTPRAAHNQRSDDEGSFDRGRGRFAKEHENDAEAVLSRSQRQPSVASSPDGSLSIEMGGLDISEATVVPDNGQIFYSPKEQITDVDLLSKGFGARARVVGSKEKSEPLDPRYKRQSKPQEFFRIGRVIKVLWSEPIGFNGDNLTVVTMEQKFIGEKVAVKIRWFVVIKEGDKWCTCLPISTYGGRGLSRKDLSKWQHSVMFTGRRQPDLLHGEEPQAGELGFLLPIRVKANNRQNIMDPASRLHYAKMYTIEHNVKVFDFGMVIPDHISIMESQWKQVMGWTQTLEASGETSEGGPSSQSYGNTNSGYGNYSGASNARYSADVGATSQYYTAGGPAYNDAGYYQQRYNDGIHVPEQEGEGVEEKEEEEQQEEEGEDEDEDEEASMPEPPPPYIDYAVVRVSYQPSQEGLAQTQIPIRKNQRLGIYSGTSIGWYRAWNQETNEVGLVWKDHITLDSHVLAQ